jgi:vitamin B12 transporter
MITPIERLRISAEIVTTGPFQDYLVDDSGNSTRVGRAPSGMIANLAASYDITPQLTAFTVARNVGGSRFEPAQGFQTPGASVMAGLRARF